MRIFLLITTFVLGICSFGISQDSLQNYINKLAHSHDSLIGQPFPQFDNGAIGNTIFQHKITLVNFWFATCAPCIKEFNALNALNGKLKKEKDFQLIAFTFENQDVIEETRNKYHLNYTIISLPEKECQRLLQSSGYPTNIIVDKNGNIQYWKSGGEISEEKAEKFVSDSLYPKILKAL